MVIVLMGVSGSGKTTVGLELARSIGWVFHDADDHHPVSNREKMGRGVPLTEEDREPWFEHLGALIRQWISTDEGVVLACSALSDRGREILGAGSLGVAFVHLRGPEPLIRERLEHRIGHYFDASLLASQFAALEAPRGALEVSIEPPPEVIARCIRQELELE